MVTKIQKRWFNLKPVTNCYNLIEEKACLLQAFSVYYSMIRNDNKGEKVMNLETKKILMNDCSAMDLDSVGSYITKDLKVFPIGETNEDVAVHIYDLTDFFEFVELNTYEIVAGPFSVWKTKLWGKWEEVNNCYMNLEAI